MGFVGAKRMGSSFHLDSEPWILVEDLAGQRKELSLTEVFEQAGSIRRLIGNPLEVAVLIRLLLAIAHRVSHPASRTEWGQRWKNRKVEIARMADYVRQNTGYFDLYNETNPFGQHPQLHYGEKPPSVLQYDRATGNNAVFLDADIEVQMTPVPSAEIARAMLTNFAFGGSHPDKRSPLARQGSMTMYSGPLCARTISFLEGDDLEKTIVMNLISRWKSGAPSWEIKPPNHPGRSKPSGWADMYTRRTRFVRLHPIDGGSQCSSVALHMGEQIEENTDGLFADPMIPRYVASDGKLKDFRLQPGKALWRSLNVLLCCTPGEGVKTGTHKASECVRQLKGNYYPCISEEEPVRLRVIGVCGNAQGPKTEFWRDETLPFRLSLLGDDELFSDIDRNVAKAESEAKKLERRLYAFARRYLQAGQPNPDSKDVAKLAEELGQELHDYWSVVGADGETLASRPKRMPEDEWKDLTERASKDAYRMAIDRLPPSAARFRAEYQRTRSKEE
ncbi:MAG: type I-E CRISPR-associated protein Cse1/CasA [Fimbriimonadaceae bacterium]|nr:type I-E CRISPR-associated protein Cse1/CasA [Fimbriimonadaceae bacterium]